MLISKLSDLLIHFFTSPPSQSSSTSSLKAHCACCDGPHEETGQSWAPPVAQSLCSGGCLYLSEEHVKKCRCCSLLQTVWGWHQEHVLLLLLFFLQAFQVVEDCGSLSPASLVVVVVVGGRQTSKQALSLCAFIAGMEEGSGGTGDGTLF